MVVGRQVTVATCFLDKDYKKPKKELSERKCNGERRKMLDGLQTNRVIPNLESILVDLQHSPLFGVVLGPVTGVKACERGEKKRAGCIESRVWSRRSYHCSRRWGPGDGNGGRLFCRCLVSVATSKEI